LIFTNLKNLKMTDEDLKRIVREVVMESHQAVALVQSKQYQAINDNLTQLNGFGKLAKFIRTDIGVAMSVLLFLVSVLAPYFGIKNDISLIQNDMHYIKSAVTEVRQATEVLQENSIDINNRVSKIEGFLTTLGLGTKLK